MLNVQSTFLEYPDNSSIASIFYFSGCDRNCEGCQNTSLKEYTPLDEKEVLSSIVNYSRRLKTNKVVLCGGDPLYKKNIDLTRKILYNLGKDFDICIYTGALIDEVKKLNLNGFKFIKCGVFDKTKFIGSKKTDDYIQFATSNQELYNEFLELVSHDGIYYF